MLQIKDIRDEPVAVISDDLTGANEIGLVLAEHLTSNLVLNSAAATAGLDPLMEGYAGVVVNLNTRDRSGPEAHRLVAEVLRKNPKLRRRLIYKKIDSTLRGHLIEELEAILDNDLAEAIYVVPASPRMQRYTVGGYHMVGNRPINRTEYAASLAVAGTSYLPDLLGRSSKYKVASIGLRQVAAGCRQVEQLTGDYYRAGIRILVCDACSHHDLAVIREALMNSPLKILPVGSAALFQEFFTHAPQPAQAPCMIICGSLNRQSRIQVQKLLEEELAVDLPIDLNRGLSGRRESEIERIAQLAAGFYQEKRNLLIRTPAAPFSPDSKAGRPPPDSLPSEIARLLADMTASLLQNLRISGLILTGGSIAAEVIGQLAGKGIILDTDLGPFVPVGRLAGGPFDGLRVITKGGGVGYPDILIRAVHYLRSNRAFRSKGDLHG
jgi:uncharacterized protein YgbK (DUF1537 family)